MRFAGLYRFRISSKSAGEFLEDIYHCATIFHSFITVFITFSSRAHSPSEQKGLKAFTAD